MNITKKLFFSPQWFIGIRKNLPCKIDFNMSGYYTMIPPLNHFYADPFLFHYSGKDYLFFEDYQYKQDKGVIAYLEIMEDFHFTQPQTILEKEYHLSYPYIFQWNGQIYMIPETSQNHTIELYRAVDFPSKWIMEKVLFHHVNASDTTISSYNGKMWLFTSIHMPDCTPDTDLFLFYADSLVGPWIPHPRNPIVSDIHRARPGGRPFIHDDYLIRPGQDCSKGYGYGLSFSRVDIINEKEYEETSLYTVEPSFMENNLCIHTYNFNNHYEVIDGKRMAFDPWKSLRSLRRMIRKILYPFRNIGKSFGYIGR